MLSFSNFGSVRHPAAGKVQQAVALLHAREPNLQVDGEMQADTAVVERILTKTYPFSKLRGPANVLIFPNLDAANICYKLLDRVGGAQAIGPILVGMAQPVHVLQRGSEVNDIVNMARSEEHTSELQSPCNLVCRLLLEKKKKNTHNYPSTQKHDRNNIEMTVT